MSHPLPQPCGGDTRSQKQRVCHTVPTGMVLFITNCSKRFL
ncbi:hypothetical protein DVU_0131 [Nitratidesulfovibrio vulgaris str. Hildenborough]|uniref:Uncharacterized protein n=1 Tax=Nitratidesulfovibrio vulgaris (strain ATCC 29579 / DSM 644 / CCUG 34227 / NCIMB 8303 / VKM B-1760 / Hildenborough) TaxID=882 RepID=Q72FT2_NITV2|nr:hypothetical protein DVU_0131 [Nitratidesulfovibrio vulgaris str. Hildenborough]